MLRAPAALNHVRLVALSNELRATATMTVHTRVRWTHAKASALRPELAAAGRVGRQGNWRLPTLAVWGSEDSRGKPAPLLAVLPWAQRLELAGAPHPAYLPPFTGRFHTALAVFLDTLPVDRGHVNLLQR